MRHIITHLNPNEKKVYNIIGYGFSVNEITPFNAKIYVIPDYKNDLVKQLIGRNIKYRNRFKTFTIINTEEYPVDVNFYIIETYDEFQSLNEPSIQSQEITNTDSIMYKHNYLGINGKAGRFYFRDLSLIKLTTSLTLIYFKNAGNKSIYLNFFEIFPSVDLTFKIYSQYSDVTIEWNKQYAFLRPYKIHKATNFVNQVGLNENFKELQNALNIGIATSGTGTIDSVNQALYYSTNLIANERFRMDYKNFGLLILPPDETIEFRFETSADPVNTSVIIGAYQE